MRLSSKRRLAQGVPLTWGDVEEMYSGDDELVAALRSLSPISDDEATALLMSHQTVAAARTDLLPSTAAGCSAVRDQAILSAAARVAATAGHRMRDAVTMMYELIAATGEPDPLPATDGLLWGPVGAPCPSPSGTATTSAAARWAAHAAALGARWDESDRRRFEDLTAARFASEAADGATSLEALPATVLEVAASVTAERAATPPARAVALRALGSRRGPPEAQSSLTKRSTQAHAAAATIRDAAVSAMSAARSLYMSNTADITDTENRALAVIRAAGWVDGVVTRWTDIAPRLPDNGTYFEVDSPTVAEFWLGALTVARAQIGYADSGMHGMATVLVGRA